MIDQKQVEKANSEKKTRQEEIKETGFKDSYISKKHSYNSKLNENIKINAQEYSFNDAPAIILETENDHLARHINTSKHYHNPKGELAKNDQNESLKRKTCENYSLTFDNYEKNCKLNYFSLPKYGLEEKTTQTDFTCKDIENLKYLSDEFNSLKEEFVIKFIANQPDILKKLYHNSFKKKDVATRIKVNLKRRVDPKIHEKTTKNPMEIKAKFEKKEKKTVFMGEKSSEINIKTLTETNKKSVLEAENNKAFNTDMNTNESKEDSLNGIKEHITLISENFLSKKHFIESIIDSIDKDKTKKEEIPILNPVIPTIFNLNSNINVKKEMNFDKLAKKQISLEKKLTKIQKKQKFDPFNFFKNEYLCTNRDKDEHVIFYLNLECFKRME